MTIRPDWRSYALLIARTAALRSEDPYRQVGACVLRSDRTVASIGYNGPPPGINIDWSNRDARRKRVIHAEANALRYVSPGEGVILAATTMPCLECLKLSCAQGIKHIVYEVPLTNTAVYDVPEILAITQEFKMSMERLDISRWIG